MDAAIYSKQFMAYVLVKKLKTDNQYEVLSKCRLLEYAGYQANWAIVVIWLCPSPSVPRLSSYKLFFWRRWGEDGKRIHRMDEKNEFKAM